METNRNVRRRFGDFEFDSQAGKLFRDGRPVKIQPQPLRVLAVLVERPGQIVSREQLRALIWDSATFVEFDQGLNYCIRQIRLALGDDANSPAFIETLPKQGYRFIAPVEGNLPTPDDLSENVAGPTGRGRNRTWLIAAAAAVVLAGIWWTGTRKPSSSIPLGPPRLSKVTSFAGEERDPAFSPDGRSVAFSWDGEQRNNQDIYVMPVGSQTPVRLTQDPGSDISPAWSPDGSQIAFIRLTSVADGNLMVMPSGGGSERVVRPVQIGENFYRAMRPLLTWTSDGKGIVYTSQDQEFHRASLYLTDLRGVTARKLFTSDEGTLGNTSPAITRDGKWLAYTTVYGPYQARLLVVPLMDGLRVSGTPTPVSSPPDTRVISPVWAPDGKSLFFAKDTAIFEWAPGGAPTQIHIGSGLLAGLSAAWGPGSALRIMTAESSHKELWMSFLQPGGLAVSGNPSLFAPSTNNQANPQFSPDGRRVAFESNRTGAYEVWLTDANGRNPQQLTHLKASIIGYPRWSPDGARLAFHVWVGNKPQIFVSAVENLGKSGDGATKITDAPFGFIVPSWSADGKYLYVSRIGGSQTFRIPAGGGAPETLFEGSGGRLTTDGHKLVYFKVGHPGIFSRSLDGDPATNPEERLVDDYRPPGGDLNLFPDGLYYISWNGEGKPRAIRFYGYAHKKSVDVAVLPGAIGSPPDLAVSPDRSRLVYQQLTGTGTDLTLIEFR